MSTVRLLVCGGRDYRDEERVEHALDRLLRKHSIEVLIHGAASGADLLASRWAGRNGVPCQSYPAHWDRLGRKAGPLRNQEMIDDGRPTAAVAFPGGRGTADMCRRLQASAIPVWRPWSKRE